MRRIRKSPAEVRNVIFALALALAMTAGVTAYEAARFENCASSCGPCVVSALGCDSCSAGSSGGECFAEGSGCDEIVCDCNDDPSYECTYYET